MATFHVVTDGHFSDNNKIWGVGPIIGLGTLVTQTVAVGQRLRALSLLLLRRRRIIVQPLV